VLAALRIKKPPSNEANRQRANSNHSNHQRPLYQRQATTSSLNNGVATSVGGGGANGSGNGCGSGNGNGTGGEATKKTVSLQVPEKSAAAAQSGGGLVIDPPSSISSHATGASAVLPGGTTGGNVTPATPETANRANDAAAGTGGNSPQTPSITPRCGSDAPRTPTFFPPPRVSSLGSNLNRNVVPGGGDLGDDDSPTANRRPPSPRPLTASPKLSNHYSIPNEYGIIFFIIYI
jgi:hypothetical protein